MKNFYIALATFAIVLMFMLNHERANAQLSGYKCYNPSTGAIIRPNSWGQCPSGWDKV